MTSPSNSTPMRAVPRRPLAVVAKPTGAACNLDCSYCYFLSKETLWDASTQTMDDQTLRTYLANLLEAHPDGEVSVPWQGGEPTMRGLDFFRRAQRLTDELARPGQRVQHSLQTNATLLDDHWGDFLARHGWLVGVSIDGPAPLHDIHRTNRAGRATHAEVVRGWRVLERHGVERAALCTVHDANAAHGLEVYRYLRDDLGATRMQFIPIVERVEAGAQATAERGWRSESGERVLYRQRGAGVTSRTVDPKQWGAFLIAAFDEWAGRDIGTVSVQLVDVALGNLLGEPSLCVHAPECGSALAMNHNGTVYSCDHFVEPEFALGSIASDSFADLLDSPRQREFGRAKRTSLPGQCRTCPVRWACHGGCPKDRFMTTADGEPGLNYLCAGYFDFFSHITPTVDAMARLVAAGRPPSDLLAAAPPATPRPASAAPGEPH